MTDGWGSGEGVRLLLLCDTSIVITITAQDSPKVTHQQEDTMEGNGQERTGQEDSRTPGLQEWGQEMETSWLVSTRHAVVTK